MTDDRMKALEFLKDWSNYLLVTTVAALGWVTSESPIFFTEAAKPWCIWLFAISITFGIFTLGLIPLVAETLSKSTETEKKSIYSITPSFNLLYIIGPVSWFHLKHFCWVQHAAFILGIALYAWGTS